MRGLGQQCFNQVTGRPAAEQDEDSAALVGHV